MDNKLEQVPDDTLFTSLAQCSLATGVPIAVLKYATKHKDALNNSNGCKYANRIKWLLLKPWLEKNAKQATADVEPEDYDKWLALKTKAQAELAQLELEQKRETLMDRSVFIGILKRISLAQNSLMNSKFRQEIIPKLQGKSEAEQYVLMDAAIAEYLSILNKELDKWT